MTASMLPHAAGFEAELLQVSFAQLYLVDGEESLLMKSGDFVLRLTKQSDSPLAVVLASVEDVHWPVGKDSPTFKMRSRHFAFVMSGLIYGLVLPESTPAQVLTHLEVLLLQYSTFEVRQERILSGGAAPFEQDKPSPAFWTALAPEILKSSVKLLGAIGGSALASTIMKRRRLSVSAASDGKVNFSDSGGLDSSTRSMKRVQLARQISAVSKLLSRTLVRGALSASNHVASMCTPQIGTQTNAQASIDHVAVASVDVVAKIVDAVESAGKSILSADHVRGFADRTANDLNDEDDHQDNLAKRKGSRSGSSNLSWTLNRTGLALLLRVTAASAKQYLSYSSPTTQPSSLHDYMSFSSAHENNSDDLQAKSSLSDGNIMRSETCLSSAEGSPSSPGASSFLPELSLSPNPAFSSSQAHHAALKFFSKGADLSQVPSAHQHHHQHHHQLQPPTTMPAMPNIGFTPFIPPNRYGKQPGVWPELRRRGS